MRSLGDRKQKRRVNADAYVFAALSLVSFSVLLFSARSFVIDFKNLGLSMFSGIRGSIHGVSSFVSRTVLSIQELATLRREYAELTDRMTRYEQLERSAAEIRRENNRLREQLGFSDTLRFRHIPAELIGRDPDNLFSAFVINKGKRDGLADNMPVIAYQNGVQALAGKVIQAGQFESLVMPVYDPSFFVSSRLSESRYEGLVEGQGLPESPLLMRLIRKRARDEINFGEIIITSGLGGLYPAGINIGRVSRILYQEYETSMEVELESFIDFSQLEYVFVIDPEARPVSTAEMDAPSAWSETGGDRGGADG
jgi:rod shape-determining protein MreC